MSGKTKRVELKGFIHDSFMEQGEVAFGRNHKFSAVEADGYHTPAAISFEVPIPEKSVTITESEFDAAVYGTDRDFRKTSATWQELLKSKLFGSGV